VLQGEPPQDVAGAKEYIDEALSIAMHAMRAAIHSTLGSSPGSLTFNRDMFLNIPLINDCHTITQRREHQINETIIIKIKRVINTTMSLIKGYFRKNEKLCKLGKRTSGLYRVLQIRLSGTLTIE
jgi:hypothetical protein